MSEFYVERQYWARWPRVLLMCRKHGNPNTGAVTVERRRYVPERTCEWQLVHCGPLYDKYRCSDCGYEYVESRTDDGATELDPNFCPKCGKAVGE